MGGGVSLGNALLSRWRMLERAHWPLPVADGQTGRCLGYALLDAPCGRVPVFVTHLSWQFHVSDERCRQVRFIDDKVREIVGRGSFPVLLLGDFNAQPESDEIRFLRGLTPLGGRSTYWSDCFALAGEGAGATFDRRNAYAATLREPPRRIDYVFVRGPDREGRGEPLAARVVLDRPSGGVWPTDHFGVYAEIAATAAAAPAAG